MNRYDVCVIGGGPSGYAAAMRAIDLGKRTLLIEKNQLGGAGIFNGALSSKTLWELAENYSLMKATAYGYQVKDYSLDYNSVLSEMHNAEQDKYKQLLEQIRFFMDSGQLDFKQGHGKLVGQHQIEISNHLGSELVETETVILATGSRPRKLSHIPIDEDIIVTSDGIGNFKKFPESIVILGAGVIGCEFATILSNFGRTKVFLIDKQARILPFEDEDIASVVAKRLEEKGVTIHREAELISMQVKDGRVEYVLSYPDGRIEAYQVEKALVSVGRVPNVENLGLEAAGIVTNGQNFCENDDCRTNVPNIFAVGDLTADIALVNIAELEGRHAVEKAYGVNQGAIKYDNISTIMFLNPEVAAVGMNEIQARKSGIPYRVASISYEFISRAIAKRQKTGFFKIMVTDDEEMKILGMRAAGTHASSNIQAMALLIFMNRGIHELAEMVHAHPSMPEGVQECARMLLGKSIMKPKVFRQALKCYRVDAVGNKEPLFEEALILQH